MANEPSEVASFPSHIGSRSTRNISLFSGRWRNGFHPTLVLAQPLLSKDQAVLLLGFHPTLVLAQLQILVIYKLSYHVSIPHWFSLNQERKREKVLLQPVSIPHWFSLN